MRPRAVALLDRSPTYSCVFLQSGLPLSASALRRLPDVDSRYDDSEEGLLFYHCPIASLSH